jgi:hypothetical protein
MRSFVVICRERFMAIEYLIIYGVIFYLGGLGGSGGAGNCILTDGGRGGAGTRMITDGGCGADG